MQSVTITVLDPKVGHPLDYTYEVHDGGTLAAVINGTFSALTKFEGAVVTNIEVI